MQWIILFLKDLAERKYHGPRQLYWLLLLYIQKLIPVAHDKMIILDKLDESNQGYWSFYCVIKSWAIQTWIFHQWLPMKFENPPSWTMKKEGTLYEHFKIIYNVLHIRVSTSIILQFIILRFFLFSLIFGQTEERHEKTFYKWLCVLQLST